MERCDECGFGYHDLLTDQLPDEIAALGIAFSHRILAGHGGTRRDALSHRPDPETWSVLEYAGHVRDVLIAQRERLFLALVEDCPSFAPIYRDRRAVLAHYADEDPVRLADEIIFAANLFARSFSGIDAEGRSRRCMFFFPEPAERTLEWLARHTLHEGVHHLFDVDRLLGTQ